MSLPAEQRQELDDLLGGVVGAMPAPGVQRLNGSQSNVVEFPEAFRLQDIVFELMKRGKGYEEIAEITKTPVGTVEKVARSEWMQREFQSLAKSGDQDSVRNLLRMHAYDAVKALGEIVKSATAQHKDRLCAVRMILDFTLTPAKEKDWGGKQQSLGMTPDELRAESDRLEREIATMEQRKKKTL